jgi:hypothetical protein
MGAEPYSDRRILPAERYSIAVITLDEQMFREMRGALASSFRATLASTGKGNDVEAQIRFLGCHDMRRVRPTSLPPGSDVQLAKKLGFF